MAKARTKVDAKNFNGLYAEIVSLTEQSKLKVASVVNQNITLLYWNIGKAVNNSILKNKRADYGDTIVATLSQQLSLTYGAGFAKSSLHRMISFYKTFSDEEKIATLSQQLSWSHFIELITIENALSRDFYLELSIRERWSVRILRQQMASMLFERTALSKKPEQCLVSAINSTGQIAIEKAQREFQT